MLDTMTFTAVPLELEINKVFAAIKARHNEIKELTQSLDHIMHRLSLSSDSEAKKSGPARRFYQWPNGARRPVTRGRPPKGAILVSVTQS